MCCGVDGAADVLLLEVAQLVQFRSSLEESLGVGGTSLNATRLSVPLLEVLTFDLSVEVVECCECCGDCSGTCDVIDDVINVASSCAVTLRDGCSTGLPLL